jgi:hypothetical protein
MIANLCTRRLHLAINAKDRAHRSCERTGRRRWSFIISIYEQIVMSCGLRERTSIESHPGGYDIRRWQ